MMKKKNDHRFNFQMEDGLIVEGTNDKEMAIIIWMDWAKSDHTVRIVNSINKDITEDVLRG